MHNGGGSYLPRWTAGLAILAVGVIAIAGGRWFLSEAYQQAASAMSASAAQAMLAADQWSVTLAPWRVAPRTRLARSLIATGHPAADVIAQFHLALAASPGDALLWQDYAQILAYEGELGDELERAVVRADALGGVFPSIQWSNAALGLRYWFLGSASLQQRWLASMAAVMRGSPTSFLYYVWSTDQAYWFCASAALELPVGDWCKKAIWERPFDPLPGPKSRPAR